MIEVRAARMEDIPVLQAIEVDAGQLFRTIGLDRVADDDPPSPETLAEHIGEATAWSAVEGLVVAGYALASTVDGEGHLCQVSVRRAFAGRRIGSLLVDRVCGWAAENGYDAITLTTFVGVPWNGPYYERLGFAAIDAPRCGPDLRAIRQQEREAGLDVLPRTAMRLMLHDWDKPALRT